jgi:NADPH-dependent glutamate synthase beta subunit-like oxidoreductase/Pyruvate/2-oxoacid:ferredoxin oxidoreductase delta subunit
MAARTETKAATEKLTYRRFKEGEHEWRDWPSHIFQASHSHKCPTYQKSTPPCQASCPSGEDIRGYLAIARGTEKPPAGMAWQEYAWRRLTEANPFPAVMGRVCPAPCESGCNRNEVEDFVGINSVEHFLGEYAIANGLKFEQPKTKSGKKVAVIGGGPAGLSCAYQLARMGHAVTVFDEHEQLGGMMRYGIPGFRTPREVLDAEIRRILDLGIEPRLKTRIGTDVTLEQLRKDYDAVFMGMGAQGGRPLPAPGAEAPNCVTATAFLRAFNDGRMKSVGRRVVVVGGGDTSIDVATVARRLGHIEHPHATDHPESVILGKQAQDVAEISARQGADVTLTSVFAIDKMQANPHEVEHALAEGIVIRDGWAPVEVVRDASGRATGLKIAKCEAKFVGPKLEIKVDESTAEVIPADLVVSAVGQAVDFTGLEDFDNGKGLVSADKNYQIPGKPGFFAGGDVLRPHLLTTAIGQGWIAAEGIDRHLRGEGLDRRPKIDVHAFDLMRKLAERGLEPNEAPHEAVRGTGEQNIAVHNYEDRSARYVIPHDELFLGHFTYVPRNQRKVTKLTPEEALGNFQERLDALSEKEAVAEGKRCMSCGLCFECDNCVVYCPQTAVFRVKKDKSTTGRYVDTDYTKCIGCHICSDVCPTGYIQMGMGE